MAGRRRGPPGHLRARAVTGWTGRRGQNIWRASVPAGLDSRQLYVNGAVATRARTQVNRTDFTATTTGLTFTNGALTYLNNLANENRIEVEGVNSFTDRYSPVQSITGNVLTMQQPAWNNNTLGYDTIIRPFRTGPFYLANAQRVPRRGRGVVPRPRGRRAVLQAAGRGEHEQRQRRAAALQSLLRVGGTYDAPAHHITFSGISSPARAGCGPSSDQGYADQQTGAYICRQRRAAELDSCQ